MRTKQIKATYTHSEYVTYIVFQRQQFLIEIAPILRRTYVACLISYWQRHVMNNKSDK